MSYYRIGARYYDADIGMWISPDPARQHFSPYTYGSNNPVNRVDPDGRNDIIVGPITLDGRTGSSVYPYTYLGDNQKPLSYEAFHDQLGARGLTPDGMSKIASTYWGLYTMWLPFVDMAKSIIGASIKMGIGEANAGQTAVATGNAVAQEVHGGLYTGMVKGASPAVNIAAQFFDWGVGLLLDEGETYINQGLEGNQEIVIPYDININGEDD
jgi:uncharacterized protein RhaS with RHS repeats